MHCHGRYGIYISQCVSPLTSVDNTGTEGLVRGRKATDTGSPIMIPVGEGTLGRIMNVTGDPIDERGPIKHTKKRTLFIHLSLIHI